MKKLSYFRLLPALFITALFLTVGWGCSTQKNALPNRVYHSTNAKYNGFFNARESYREGLRRLSIAHIDNYEQVLSIYRYGNEQQATAISSYMDVAYQKASLVIRRHSMNIRGIEYNKWIDESFYLIARSHYFKRDFNLALLTFEYIVREYSSDIKYESKIWMAKTYHQLGRFDDATQILERVAKNLSDGLLSRNTQQLYQLVYADHFIRQEAYSEAVPHLVAGTGLTRNKKDKTRLTFILAQVYQHIGDYGNAQQTYMRVLRMNPPFDLAFRTRISMAMAYDPNRGGADNIEAELARMLRDKKNADFVDQIYYALAQLALRQGKEEQAISYLIKSTEESEKNRLQKGLSFKLLGEIHFERPDYLNASIYYDSAATFIPQQHENFREVNARKGILSSLASNLRIIDREDSLQRLASMTVEQRKAVVDRIIEDLREQERQDRLIEEQMRRAASQIAQTRMSGGIGGEEGGWYFYNPTTLSFGRTEFFSKYGNRPLEDFWRISNKIVSEFDMEMDDPDLDEDQQLQGDIYDPQTYLRNIPDNPEAIERSNLRIANAYYNMSNVFKDQLNDYQSAVNSLETLIQRFPDSDKKLYAYYYLYSLYRELNDPSKADVYKNRLVAEFPDSEFARILGDPNYFEQFMARQRYTRDLYTQAFNSFRNSRYNEVLQFTSQVDSLDMTPDLRSQFDYLKALATGKLGKGREFRQQLQNIADKHQGKLVHQPASVLLASLDAPGQLFIEFAEETGTDDDFQPGMIESIFSYRPDIIHFFVFVVPSRTIDISQIRNFIQTFNNQNYPDNQLSASSIFLDENRQIITVANFRNKDEGLDYYEKIMSPEGLATFRGENFFGFIISVDNYPTFYQEKNIEDYLVFFRHYYLKP